jgi:chromatin remodeling complex protein RSC6
MYQSEERERKKEREKQRNKERKKEGRKERKKERRRKREGGREKEGGRTEGKKAGKEKKGKTEKGKKDLLCQNSFDNNNNWVFVPYHMHVAGRTDSGPLWVDVPSQPRTSTSPRAEA